MRRKCLSPWKRRLFPQFSTLTCASMLTSCFSWIPPLAVPGRPMLTSTVVWGSGAKSNEDDSFEYVEYCYDDDDATSQFGTKEYWDGQYQGRGDFPMDEYQWYFGFEQYEEFIQTYVPSKDEEILIPGIGNDPILLNLLQKGYSKLTATDYSEFAIDRQKDLLSYQRYPFSSEVDGSDDDIIENDKQRPTKLLQMDARRMHPLWTQKFDAIVEKGVLDAISLSGNGNVELATKEFLRILKPGGILISVSCAVPADLRLKMFREWTWIRDGSDDLEAGCFVFKSPK